MKTIHKILIAIIVLLVVLIGWFWFGGALKAEPIVATARASDFPDAFTAAAAIVRSGASQQVFSEASLDSVENYELVDASINLKNSGLFKAEWLEIEVTGGDGDVAVYSLTGANSDVSPFGSSYVNVKLITRNAEASRSATISYYVLGMKRSITVPLK